MAALAARLPDFELEDADEYDLDGRPVAYHRFAHRGPLGDLVSEQWGWLGGGLGTCLTATVARADYAEWCEVFEAIAETLEPPC
ncbi:hypothetical protein [Nocardioides pantholopis]|uniref:hypothetical protein n=1 Tax=Nocardioides pantholopis TaxID=2483798 RepID=UPI000F08E486|nr:hypothetical protein [Nocardioides pantholopis]